MTKTTDAVKIIDTMIGDDADLRKLVADARASSEIAEMVYNARLAAGLTQQQLAEVVGTRQSVIARLEDADYQGHSLTMLQRIAEALNCHVEVSMVPNNDRPQVAP